MEAPKFLIGGVEHTMRPISFAKIDLAQPLLDKMASAGAAGMQGSRDALDAMLRIYALFLEWESVDGFKAALLYRDETPRLVAGWAGVMEWAGLTQSTLGEAVATSSPVT